MPKPKEAAESGDKPLPPRESLVRARTAAQAYLADLGLPGEKARELSDIVNSALDERFGEFEDLRIGRVIGSALATL